MRKPGERRTVSPYFSKVISFCYYVTKKHNLFFRNAENILSPLENQTFQGLGGEKMNAGFPTKLLWRYVLSMFSPAKSRQLSAELVGDAKAHSLPEILRHFHKTRSFGGLLKADAVLFGWALVLTALIDLFLGRAPMVQSVFGATVSFLMCHIADESLPRAFLITAFLFTLCISDGSWFLAALFIILFEHIGVEEKSQ